MTMRLHQQNPYLPMSAEVIEARKEAIGVVTLRLRLTDSGAREAFRFGSGQFNMLYLGGVGEAPISISSDPENAPDFLDHTIRAVGGVTQGLVQLDPGAIVGLRGPFGTGWPMERARGRNLLVVTGGIGCAPTASVVQYALKRREQYGKIIICHGVRNPQNLIYGKRFEEWCHAPGTSCRFAAQEAGPNWRGRTGLVTSLFDDLEPDAVQGMAMICGPEPMMKAAAEQLLRRAMPIEDIYLSLERNMQCGIGHCGNCQMGANFICTNGPVLNYAAVRNLMKVKGC